MVCTFFCSLHVENLSSKDALALATINRANMRGPSMKPQSVLHLQSWRQEGQQDLQPELLPEPQSSRETYYRRLEGHTPGSTLEALRGLRGKGPKLLPNQGQPIWMMPSLRIPDLQILEPQPSIGVTGTSAWLPTKLGSHAQIHLQVRTTNAPNSKQFTLRPLKVAMQRV